MGYEESKRGSINRHERNVLSRVAELRREGLWALSRLPMCVNPPRNRTTWDYMLDEAVWMAVDFKCERIWKVRVARSIAFEAQDYVKKKRSGK
ncbi:hypothetical protein QR680_016466 [Steinernema hermaphroditum]|uniref:HSA domain-containing protein n=1 Tax=Steinernema hermaphroditum TaxID=289476 RepID=A0AA39HBA7_9BILA|nr:hypothetical protein QR680_016466 [Steinernema hermaphroditum]